MTQIELRSITPKDMIVTVQPDKNTNTLLLSGISWTQLEILETAFENVGGVRLSYCEGILEIMNLSPEHEDAKRTISLLLESYLREKKIRFYSRGSATLGNREIGAKKEPDKSYNIGSKKAIPDLAIEVVVSSGGINKLELYQRLGIPEVWFWEDGVLSVYQLQNEYRKVSRSRFLPELDLSVLAKFVRYHDQYDAVTEFLETIKS
jgi:Uma2 family endonuclease